MVNATSASSAAGVLALLYEDDADLQAFALEELEACVDVFWGEAADHLSRLEVLFEDAKFARRELAALVTSRVYYHLGDLNEALSFALGAGKLFDIGKMGDQYVETMIAQCIDRYVEAQSADAPTAGARLKQIVERMFQRCIDDKEYRQALGIALEARRLDVIERVFGLAHDRDLLAYVLEAAVTTVRKRDFRQTVLRLLVSLFGTLAAPDYFSIAQCYVYLNDAPPAGALLRDLLAPQKAKAPANDRLLTAYQIAFDLADTATQEFLGLVRAALGGSDAPAANGQSTGDAMETDAEQSADAHVTVVRRILAREESIKLYLEFLFRNNRADLLVLKTTKDALEARNSVFHSSLTFANAFANAGTTSDKFLRDNLDWLAKAANWAKFTATAALGVIYKGSIAQAMTILQPYLPADGGGEPASAFSEGGSLYALGLLNANHGHGVLDYLRRQLKASQNETLLHGCALGLGMAGMATANEELYDELREVLYNDSAVAGEAAGYAMGLVMLGTGSTKAVDEMLAYAHETQHEKIIRGLAMGLAFLVYGRQDQADGLIDTLAADQDPIVRYGGIFALALAYAGTGDNKAIRRLLHVAVSDVNDDVRRAAVIALGFLLFRVPTHVPRIVQLLVESYNPNVRYGAALALGISCAGTGLEDAVDLLEPLTKDPVDFVRQIACIALAMVLVQQNETNARVAPVRKTFVKIISDKHEDVMAKMGAALAQGLIDAGGRNCTISLQSRTGHANMTAIVGLALFSQFWYWFPLAHAASLAFTPTALIGVDADLRLPKFDFVSHAKPSLFAYLPATKPPSTEKVEKVATAVLSTTAKTKQREKAKEQEKAAGEMDADVDKPNEAKVEAVEAKVEGDDAMPTDVTATDAPATAVNGDAPVVNGDAPADAPKAKRARKDEPASEQLPNLSRVTAAQLAHVAFPPDARFVPVRDVKAGAGGILVVRDAAPDAGEAEYIAFEANKALEEAVRAHNAAPAAGEATAGAAAAAPAFDPDAPIADVPAPFEYDFGSG